LSAQFDNPLLRLVASRWLLVGLCVALLAACSSTGPSRPVADDNSRNEVEPDRRGRRAQRRADASLEDGAAVPAYASSAYERALTAMRNGDWVEAELELEQFVLEYASYPGPYVNLAIVYMRDGRSEEARAALEQALMLDPAHAVANNELGIVLRTMGLFAEAEQAYRRAIESNPDYSLAYYNLGVLLDLYLRRQAEALEYYEQYQTFLAEPDQRVARWIIDLRRRVGVNARARVAQGDGL